MTEHAFQDDAAAHASQPINEEVLELSGADELPPAGNGHGDHSHGDQAHDAHGQETPAQEDHGHHEEPAPVSVPHEEAHHVEPVVEHTPVVEHAPVAEPVAAPVVPETHNPADLWHRAAMFVVGGIGIGGAIALAATHQDPRLIAAAGAVGSWEMFLSAHGYIRDRQHHIVRFITSAVLLLGAPVVVWANANNAIQNDNATQIRTATEKTVLKCPAFNAKFQTVALPWGSVAVSLENGIYKPGETIVATKHPASRMDSYNPTAKVDAIAYGMVPTMGFWTFKPWTAEFWSMKPTHLAYMHEPQRTDGIAVKGCLETGPTPK